MLLCPWLAGLSAVSLRLGTLTSCQSVLSPSVGSNCMSGIEVSVSTGLMQKSLDRIARTVSGWANGQLVGIEGNVNEMKTINQVKREMFGFWGRRGR